MYAEWGELESESNRENQLFTFFILSFGEYNAMKNTIEFRMMKRGKIEYNYVMAWPYKMVWLWIDAML